MKGEIAPFQINLICLSGKTDEVKDLAEKYYLELTEQKKIEVLYDDREEVRPGVKFNDSDLIGIPVQLIVGERNLKDGNVEIKIRQTGEKIIVSKDDAVSKAIELIG